MANILVNQIVKASKNVLKNYFPVMYSTNSKDQSVQDIVPNKTPYLLGLDPIFYFRNQEGIRRKLHPGEHLNDIRNRWPEAPKITDKIEPYALRNPYENPPFPKKYIDEPWRRPYPNRYAPW